MSVTFRYGRSENRLPSLSKTIAEELVDIGAVSPDDDGNAVLDIEYVKENAEREVYMELTKSDASSTLAALAVYLDEDDEYSRKPHIQVIGDVETISVSDLKRSHEGELVRIRARVHNIFQPKINRLTSSWSCQKGHITDNIHARWEPEISKPTRCEVEDCNCRPYERINGLGTKTDVQQMVLGDVGVDDRNSAQVVSEVDMPHIDTVENRDVVNAWAIVKIADTDDVKLKHYLHIVGLESDEDEIELDDDTVEKIHSIADEQDDIIKYLSDSVAPKIVTRVGHDVARTAILASIVRGTENAVGDRNTINTLLYGKPGSGKSQMLEFASETSVIAKYTDAAHSTVSGLTASVKSDDTLHGNDKWVLTAGAIPQSHEGIVCIDELDKAEKRMQTALNTPMASQKVIIEKVEEAELAADVSVVAAANPKNEIYGGQSPLEALNLPNSTQSRFDIIVRVDDEILDREGESEIQNEILNRKHEGVDDVLSKRELKEYLAYAKELEPEMSDAALEAIRDKIIDLRISSRDVDIPGVEISGREEGKITRLATAMAKLRLGSVVTVEDVERAWDVVKKSWQGLTFDSFDFESDGDLLTAFKTSQNASQQKVMRQAIGVLKYSQNDDNVVQMDTVYDGVDAGSDVIDWALNTLADKGHITVHDDEVSVIDLPV